MIIDKIKKNARDMLSDGSVNLFIGYATSGSGDVVPLFVKNAEETENLVWNNYCYYNLTLYLTDRDVVGEQEGTVGIIVKGCDLKSIRVLLSESQIKREKVKIIGVTCTGMKDKAGTILKKCEICDVSNPDESLCDAVIGEKVEYHSVQDTFQDINEINNLTPVERKKLWDDYFARCLRCYACRNICPLCYCKECIIDQHNPQWVLPSISVDGNRSFHIVRAYHLAGRCIDCGECERVCPVGIPLRKLNRKMAKVVKESFNFEAGRNTEQKPPLTWFSKDDPDDFIK